VFAFDDGGWPIVEVRFGTTMTLDEIDHLTAGFDRAFARQEPFAAVFIGESAQSEADSATTMKLMGWLKGTRTQFAAHCRGVVYVVADPAERATRAAMLAKGGEKIFGCPAGAVGTRAEALAWAHERLGAGAGAPHQALPIRCDFVHRRATNGSTML
jgi:hypothetical protein